MERVLLVGNPNSGKTTLYNSLTSADEHVGNWHGVTVENKERKLNEKYILVDTPGIYSLSNFSFEEEVTINTIEKHEYKKIINICDSNNLKRNLYLTLCLLERGENVTVAINEIDKKSKYKIDAKKLSNLLGINIYLINAKKKINLEKLIDDIENTPKIEEIKYFSRINFLCLEKYLINKNKKEKLIFCVNAFEKNRNYFYAQNFQDNEIDEIFSKLPKDSIEQIIEARYAYLDEIIKISCMENNMVYGKSKLDGIFLNKFLALPCFLLVMSIIFYLTFFSVGKFFSDLLNSLLTLITSPIVSKIYDIAGDGFLYKLLDNAIFGSISTLLSFLPQVVLLLFFLSLLEDSGYLSRVAFLFEDICSKVGLSGKSVYTLLMGFGCSTTAIMTSRNMDNKNSRIKTAMLCTYMSCSAKIPIYTIIGGAFFGAKNIFVIWGLYLLGVVIALIISKILDLTVLHSKEPSFILELPPYRMISATRVFKILYKNVIHFVTKVGSVLISMNIVVFLLSSVNFRLQYVESGSILEVISRFIAPIFAPLGFDNWAIVSALIAGFVAKEIVVSSIAMFNGIDSSATRLIGESILIPTSVVFFASHASVLSFLVFCLLYTPCLSSVSMLLEEIGKGWTLLAVIIQLTSAYAVAFVTYNIALLFELWGWVVALYILGFVIIICALLTVIRIIKSKRCPYCKEGCKKCKKGEKVIK